MINVSEITNAQELLDMKKNLNFFINKKIVVQVYQEQGKDMSQLNDDRRLARELLIEVNKQLQRFNQPTMKPGLTRRPQGT